MRQTQLSLFFESISFLKNWSIGVPRALQVEHSVKQSVEHTIEHSAEKDRLSLIWDGLARRYFPDCYFLKDYSIRWSNRHQTNCLASVNIAKKIVRVAPAMKLPEAEPYLEALIYHEMCHAIVGIKYVGGRRRIHTREFKLLEHQHPGIILLDKWIKDGGWASVVKKSKRQRTHKSRL